MKTRSRKKKPKPPYEEEFITFVGEVEGDTTCPVCQAEFLDEDDLKIHLTQVHENEPQGITICKLCEGVFCSLSEFVTHFTYNHLENLIICNYCYRTFTDTVALVQHKLRHSLMSDNSSMTCSQCSLIFTSKIKLQEHEYKVHRDSEDGIMINNAFSLLSSSLNMSIPNFLESLLKNKDFSCIQCNHISYDVSDYIQHLKSMSCESVACDKCYAVFRSKNAIIHHFKQHPECHNINEGVMWKCYKCEKRFGTKEIMAHERSCEAVKCSTCSIIYDNMHVLADHRLKDHSTALTVTLETCKFCLKQFVGRYNLKKHMSRAHKNRALYKYPCTHCNILFIHPSKLFAHFYTKHKNIEPYTCLICNKKFRLRRKFTIHIKVDHNSVGFVEFDSNLHVNFTDKKSENPYLPQTPKDAFDYSSMDDSGSETVEPLLKKKAGKATIREGNLSKQITDEGSVDNEKINNVTVESNLESGILGTDDNSQESDEENLTEIHGNAKKLKSDVMKINRQKQAQKVKRQKQETVTTATKYNKLPPKRRRKRKTIVQQPAKRPRMSKVDNLDTMSIDFSDEEPLSNINNAPLKQPTISITKEERKRNRNIRRLTCTICQKYCFTVQNYHHHMSLHEKSKLKRCIKCREYFKSRKDLKNHIVATHSSSKLTETLKSLLEKRKVHQPEQKSTSRPAETIKSLLEQRKKSQLTNIQNTVSNKFRKTIRKVITTDDVTATITPMSEHGISVKNFIENFRPDGGDTVSISNSVTIKTICDPVEKSSFIKLRKFKDEATYTVGSLRHPVKFQDTSDDVKGKVSVKLVQQLITKPKVINFTINDHIPAISPSPDNAVDDEYCNMFADETDYTQYKNEPSIPEVAHEVMLRDADDIPKTKQLAQEIIIPNIPDKYGGVRIGHLLPDAPFYKIVKVKKLLKGHNEAESEEENDGKNIQLPDGTQLVTVKNPFSHLIPNQDLQEILKAHKNRYYTPKVKNIGRALAKALVQKRPHNKRRYVRREKKTASVETK